MKQTTLVGVPWTLCNAIFLFCLAFMFSASNAASCIGSTQNFTYGSNVTESCTLNGSVSGSGTAFTVTASGITMDCSGYSITGTGTGTGISASGSNNVTVKNCYISGYYDGVYSNAAAPSAFINNTASNNTNGIHLEFSSNNVLANNIGSDNDYAFYVASSSNNTLANNTAYGNTNGFYLSSGSNNTLINNTASNNTNGIYLKSSSNSTLTNNTAGYNTNIGFTLDASSGNTLLNNTAQENGRYDLSMLAGANSAICNNAITNMAGSGNRPILYTNTPVVWANFAASEIILCSASGSSLSNITINGSDSLKNNALVLLWTNNTNISGSSSIGNYDGFVIVNGYGNILSGNNATNNADIGFSFSKLGNSRLLASNATSNSVYNIYLESSSNNTINGNLVSRGGSGIRIFFSSNSTISNNIAFDNGIAGIDLDNSPSITLTNNTAYGNQSYGIRTTSSPRCNLTDNLVFNNTVVYSIRIEGSDYCTVSGNTVYGNANGIIPAGSNYGVYINNTSHDNADGIDFVMGSSHNLVAGNRFYSNNGDGIDVYPGCNNYTIVNNTVYNNTQSDGIEVDGSSHNLIANNLIYDNFCTGILFHYFTFNTTVANNTIYGTKGSGDSVCSGNGIFLFFAADNIIADNLIYSSAYYGIGSVNSTNSTIYRNTVFNNRGGFYSTNSSSYPSSNYVCYNTLQDFNSQNWTGSVGANNTCGNPDGWSDTGYSGCRYHCAPPIITLLSPANNGWLNSTGSSLLWNASDNESPSLDCNTTLDGVVVNSTTVLSYSEVNVSVSGLAVGVHYWNVTCIDLGRNSGTSETWAFTVDLGSPTVNLVSPANGTSYGSGSPKNLIWNVTDDFSTVLNCSVYLNGAAISNVSVSNSTNVTASTGNLGTGNYDWHVACSDVAGNSNVSQTWSFNVTGGGGCSGSCCNTRCGDGYCDIRCGEDNSTCPQDCGGQNNPPTVILVNPADGSIIPTTSLVLNFTAKDDRSGTLSCIVRASNFISEITNSLAAANNTFTGQLVSGLLNGTHFWNVSCTDGNGATGNSQNWRFTITCGNGVCDSNENVSSCPQDCNRTPVCGEPGFEPGAGQCDATHSCVGDNQLCNLTTCTCYSNTPRSVCGDGTCSATENCTTCEWDCGKCPQCTRDSDCGQGEMCSSGQCVQGEGCQYGHPPCGECSLCKNNMCIDFSDAVHISAPLEALVNTTVTVLLYNSTNGTVGGSYITVTGPDSVETRYVTDSHGVVYYVPDKVGYYTYSVPCDKLNLTRKVITSVYDQNAAPGMRKLVIDIYLTEPSTMTLGVVDRGNPVDGADVGILDPSQGTKKGATDFAGSYKDTLLKPGKYVITVSASNVKSLAATIDLSPMPASISQGPDYMLLLLLILLLIIILMGYLLRDKLLPLFGGKKKP